VTGRDKRLALSITRYTNQAVGKGGDLRREKTMTMGLHRDSAQVEALQGQPLVFSVDLGTLELSIKDFLSLRPGSVIHIPQVTSSQGLLRYGGRPVAEVDLEVEHDGLNMKVREWLALPPQAA
jgi:flagellar motor switch/type III secretory pathway protein FliN